MEVWRSCRRRGAEDLRSESRAGLEVLRSWRSGDRGGLEVMQAWSLRGLETWMYGGCGCMEVRSGGLEGV
jgi:hypothetical protein